uniref:Olfactory receptor n=1 Tax=Sus scrofa TaxID=9823 RepID=A0A8D1K546_PIG
LYLTMDGENCSVLNEFLLLGISNRPVIKVALFTMFLVVYLIILVANLGMIMLIRMDPRLHTPMYFFLSQLSFCDLCYSTAIGPKMLVDLLAKNKAIPFYGCALQFLVFYVECLMLAVMAYDRYVAICNPLLYTVAMSRRVCTQLVAIVYIEGLVDSAIHTCCTFRLSFCNSNIIEHFFCDFPPLLALSSSDTTFNEIMLLISSCCVVGCSIITVLLSYSYILTTILRMNSAEGRRKAFSTCASHLTAVAVFHGTLLFMYFRPSSSYSMDTDKIASVFYTVVIPMLNPLIYSLRNKDVKDALKKTVSTKLCAG